MAIMVNAEDAATRMFVCCVIFPMVSLKGQRPLHISFVSKPGTENRTNRISDKARLRSNTFVVVCIVRFMATTRKTMRFPKMKKKVACSVRKHHSWYTVGSQLGTLLERVSCNILYGAVCLLIAL